MDYHMVTFCAGNVTKVHSVPFHQLARPRPILEFAYVENLSPTIDAHLAIALVWLLSFDPYRCMHMMYVVL